MYTGWQAPLSRFQRKITVLIYIDGEYVYIIVYVFFKNSRTVELISALPFVEIPLAKKSKSELIMQNYNLTVWEVEKVIISSKPSVVTRVIPWKV